LEPDPGFGDAVLAHVDKDRAGSETSACSYGAREALTRRPRYAISTALLY
jgi:hypothetical protein